MAERLIRVFHHVGFFVVSVKRAQSLRRNSMDQTKRTMAQQIAQAAIAFEQRRTGNYVPKSVTVVQVFLLGGNAPTESWSGSQSAAVKGTASTNAEGRENHA